LPAALIRVISYFSRTRRRAPPDDDKDEANNSPYARLGNEAYSLKHRLKHPLSDSFQET